MMIVPPQVNFMHATQPSPPHTSPLQRCYFIIPRLWPALLHGACVLCVVCSQLSLYMSLAPEQKLTYPLAGPDGPAAFNAGMQGFEARTFRGLGVFTSTPVSLVLELLAFAFRTLALVN